MRADFTLHQGYGHLRANGQHAIVLARSLPATTPAGACLILSYANAPSFIFIDGNLRGQKTRRAVRH